MTPDAPRRARADSRVSVIVPCFNHGVFLEECLASVDAQTLPAAEVIVVDDGSTEAYTLEVLRRVERDGRARVIRQANSGPSAARNRAVEESTAELILPLDADNRLAPTAFESMKSSLLASPDKVRWAYPHQSFFGNRNDLVVMPEFNLWLLLVRNFCDTGSLIDRSLFDAGCRYREDIGLGHEDWDFFLGAVDRGFEGVPCHERVFYVRKHGFTRSELVDHQFGSFATEIRRLHPDLFAPENLLRVKQEWAPALSVVVEGSVGSVRELFNRQSFQDFELVGERRHGGLFHTPPGGSGPLDGAFATPLRLLATAKGRWVLLWSGAHRGPLADSAFVEKAVTIAEHADHPAAVALALGNGSGTFNWRATTPGTTETCIGVLMAGELLEELVPALDPSPSATAVETLLSALRARGAVEWRSFPSRRAEGHLQDDLQTGGDAARPAAERSREMVSAPSRVALGDASVAAASRKLERRFRHREAAALHLGHEPVTRPPFPPRGAAGDGWQSLVTGAWERWRPEHTRLLSLSFDRVRSRWLLTLGPAPEPRTSYTLHIPLGRVYTQNFPGTVAFWRRTDPRTGKFEHMLGEPATTQWCDPLGFVSTAHLPGMVSVAEAVRAQLEQLRMHTGGRPVTPFELAGERETACIEAVHPPPGEAVTAKVVPWPVWALYEATDAGGRLSYSTHPDAPAVLGGERLQHVKTVARIAGPGRTANVLLEVVNETTGGRAYVNDPPHALAEGYAVSVVLGSLITGHFTDTFPLLRLVAVTPGPHTDVPEPGHRLATGGWEPLVSAGTHQPEGIMGSALPPDPDRAPLYRWRHRERPEWRYTLGTGLGQSAAGTWRFDATVGLAFRPAVDWPNLVDFVELRHPDNGRFTYACQEEAESGSHLFERVVARLYRCHEGSVVPLFQLQGPQGELVHSVNPDELGADGYRAEGPVAFVGVAVPPPSAPRAARPDPGMRRVTLGAADTLIDGLVVERPGPGLVALFNDEGAVSVGDPTDSASVLGYASPRPFPWSIPLYELVEWRTGRRVVSTNGEAALGGTHGVLRVVGFLGSPAHGLTAATITPAVRRARTGRPRSVLVAVTRLERVARRCVARLPSPARGAVRVVWLAFRRARS